MNNPGAIRAWQRAAHWIGWISPPGVVAYRELDSMNAWESGQVAFRRSWQSEFRLSHWQKTAVGDVVGYTSVPGGPRRKGSDAEGEPVWRQSPARPLTPLRRSDSSGR